MHLDNQKRRELSWNNRDVSKNVHALDIRRIQEDDKIVKRYNLQIGDLYVYLVDSKDHVRDNVEELQEIT